MDREPTDEELEEQTDEYYADPLYHLERFMAHKREYYAIQAIKAYAEAEEIIPEVLTPYLISLCDEWFRTKGNKQISRTIENNEQREIECKAVEFELSRIGSSKTIIEACKKICIEEEDPETLARKYRNYKENKNR